MGDTPLYFQTLTEGASLIESRQVSHIKETEAMLKRIEDLHGRYKSYATVMADHPMAAS